MVMVMMGPVMLVLVGSLVVVVVVVVALGDAVVGDVLRVWFVHCRVEFALPLLRLCRQRI